ncbi:MAG TPA: hypothetical protein PLA11_13835 [Flavobacteriales bacterium]|nr:hypothetical protein [Flavobacteriales bacterium]
MSAAVFEARYSRLLRLREQGYEELSDFLGEGKGLGSLARLGLLRRREEGAAFQRYHGYVPTPGADPFLLHVAERELIMVKPGQSAKLMKLMAKDPAPDAVFKPTYAEPTASQFRAVQELRDQAGRDLWRTQRAERVHERLLCGWMDLRAFTTRTGLGEGALLAAELCSGREDLPHPKAHHLEVTPAGSVYLEEDPQFGVLLIKPGMELPLFAALEPEKAAYWCGLP